MFGNLTESLKKQAGAYLQNQAQSLFSGQSQPQDDGQGHSVAPAGTDYVQSPNQNAGSYVGQANGEEFSISDCRGNKKALFVGINYFNTSAELRGCINDVKNIMNFVTNNFGFNPQNCLVLTDDQQDPSKIPTRNNILLGMKWLVEGAQPGDSLFFHYSGHGGSTQDTDGDEVDGKDETIYPLDHEQAGMIHDDEMHALMVRDLPAGCRLTAVFDSCHSGTVLDLPFTYKCSGEIEVICEDSRKEAAMSLLKAGLSYSRGDTAGAMSLVKDGLGFLMRPPTNKEAQKKTEETRKSNADVIQFAGCRDDQTSADATINNQATGAMSYALVTALGQNRSLTYTQLLQNLRDILKSKYSQIPQMSTGRPMDMKTMFAM
ncbi:metacaspase [Basidiobolus meristosporus CBS 931.73]|uniref:Metacaspase n=1 Tax=Basidiobolus meristosporus CBS 931.73 TaxID=1314790 RepID=A0A1Y1Z4P9_9FUNG|nr:metacaspase [Basidiobolus meristosporus CBS 931.73]|eukprot:ORY05241.1 metacaspase [Basidiobolus meristosporus CBS 931.73]